MISSAVYQLSFSQVNYFEYGILIGIAEVRNKIIEHNNLEDQDKTYTTHQKHNLEGHDGNLLTR